jgi:hypothetical protein
MSIRPLVRSVQARKPADDLRGCSACWISWPKNRDSCICTSCTDTDPVKRREPLMLVLLVAALLLGIASSQFVRPKFAHVQGVFDGVVERSSARVSISGGPPKQEWLVVLEDGRAFWIDVPPTAVGYRGREVQISVQCTRETAKRCIAVLNPKSLERN